MATTRTFLQNASTRHAVFVQRFAGGQIKEVLPHLERIRKVTNSRLKQNTLTKLSKKRLEKLLADLDATMAVIYNKLAKELTGNMLDFATYEADFSARMFNKATVDVDFVVPSQTALQAAIFSQPLLLADDSLSIESALRQLSKQKRKQIINTIKDGVIVGKTNADIIKDIEFVTKKVQRNHLSALTRTVTNFISTEARQATINANSDVTEGVEWVSTLDSSTTSTCQSLDGRKFPANSGPRPPIHWGCRSTVIPVVKKEFSIKNTLKSERPSVGASGAKPVDGRTTYNSWLKKQPASFQDEVLGPTKGKLYREGGLNVRSFTDDNFQPLTLKQLKRKEPAAFERAGLDE